MLRFDNDRIVLTGNTSVDFVRNVLNPPPLDIRFTFDQITIRDTEDGFTVDIPDLIIPLDIGDEELFYSIDCSYHPQQVRNSEFYAADGHLSGDKPEFYSDEIPQTLIGLPRDKDNVYDEPPQYVQYVMDVSMGNFAA